MQLQAAGRLPLTFALARLNQRGRDETVRIGSSSGWMRWAPCPRDGEGAVEQLGADGDVHGAVSAGDEVAAENSGGKALSMPMVTPALGRKEQDHFGTGASKPAGASSMLRGTRFRGLWRR